MREAAPVLRVVPNKTEPNHPSTTDSRFQSRRCCVDKSRLSTQPVAFPNLPNPGPTTMPTITEAVDDGSGKKQRKQMAADKPLREGDL